MGSERRAETRRRPVAVRWSDTLSERPERGEDDGPAHIVLDCVIRPKLTDCRATASWRAKMLGWRSPQRAGRSAAATF